MLIAYDVQQAKRIKMFKQRDYGVIIILVLILFSASTFPLITTVVDEPVPTHQIISPNPSPAILPQRSTTKDTCLTTSILFKPFYGMQFAYKDDLSTVKGLDIEIVLTDFAHDGTAADWLAFLNTAQENNIQVIPWLWPQGWTWNGQTWQIDAQANLFVQTVAKHPAVLAIYALHEPYWNGCEGCGYTTGQQQALYLAIKAIANVPLYSDVDSMAFWTARGTETAFAEGVCDYCGTWYYPFVKGGIYERQELITRLTNDLAVLRQRAPNSKFVWLMQSYAQGPPNNLRMPTAAEMRDLASIVYSSNIDGALWYPWKFDGLYSDYLFNHPELYGVVKQIYQQYVPQTKEISCVYLPVIYHN